MLHKSVTLVYLARAALISLLLLSDCGGGEKEQEIGWPRFRGPRGDGISTETEWDPKALNGGPRVLWKKNVGEGLSNVAIRNNHLYTMGARPEGVVVVVCLDAEKGTEFWQHSIVEPQPSYSTPTLDGNSVYALSNKGILMCLNAKNGKVRWQKDIVEEFQVEKVKYGYAGSPVIAGDSLFLNVNASGLALNKNTGDLIWTSEPHTHKGHREYYGTPVIYGSHGKQGLLLAACIGITSVELESGNKLWSHTWTPAEIDYGVNPVVFENKVFVSTTSSFVNLEIGENEPQVIWQNNNLMSEMYNSVLADKYLYGFHGIHDKPGTLRCIEWETGNLMWEKKMKPVQLISANGKLIILEQIGTLHFVEASPSGYAELSSCDVVENEPRPGRFYTNPVLYKGRIYCRNLAGDLICIDVSMQS